MMSRSKIPFLEGSIVLSLLFLLIGTASGQPGLRLDLDFTPGLRPEAQSVRRVLPLADSRMALVESWAVSGGFQNMLGALNEQGVRDPFYASVPGTLDLYPSGDSVFYSWQNYSGNRINRHQASDGSVDPYYPMFNLDHVNAYLHGAAVDDQGRTYVMGSFNFTDTVEGVIGPWSVLRLHPNGALDTSFSPGRTDNPYFITPLPDGGVLLCGGFHYNGVPVSTLFKVNDDGSLDTGFDNGMLWTRPHSALPLANGKVLLTGDFIRQNSLGVWDTVYVIQLLPDGSPDPDFQLSLDMPGGFSTIVTSIVAWGTEHYVIAGNFMSANGHPRHGIAMIDQFGNLDTLHCNWPGPGLLDGDVWLYVVKDVDDRLLVHGRFNGFNDGQASVPYGGLVRLVQDDTGIADPYLSPRTSRLYPLPATDHAWLEWSGGGSIHHAVIIDCTGRSVKLIPGPGEQGKLRLELKGSLAGHYVVSVILGDGSRVVQRLMVAD